MKKYLLHFLSISLFLFVGSSYALEHVDFPKTIADVSFKDRVENLKEGYEPFKNAKSYYQIHITQTENTICSEGEKQAIPHFNTGIRKDGVCKVTSCTDGYVPNSSGTACVSQESNSGGGNGQGNKTRNCNDTERMALLEKPHVTEVGNGASGCIVLACEQPDYRVNETKDWCVYVGARCPDSEASRNLLQKPHVYEIGLENSECVVKTCKDGYGVNGTKDGCECVSPNILNGNKCESIAVAAAYHSVFDHINLANEEQGKTIINLYRQFKTHKPKVTDCERNDKKCEGTGYDCLVCDEGREVYAFDDLADHRSKHVKKQAFRAVCKIFDGQDLVDGKCKGVDQTVCSKITTIYNNSLFPDVPVSYTNNVCHVVLDNAQNNSNSTQNNTSSTLSNTNTIPFGGYVPTERSSWY